MNPHVALKETESSVERKRLRLPGAMLGTVLGALLTTSVFAGGADVSTDEIYSDGVTLQTEGGDPLDIDGDGNADLAVASNRGGPAERSRYYLGNGDGTFSTPVLLTSQPSSAIVAANLNGDSFIDLVQGRRDFTDIWYLGDGAGGVGGGSDVEALDTTRTLALTVGDLDGDGDLDLVTANGSTNGTITDPQANRFYLNDFAPGGTVAFTGADISADADISRTVALADIDGDSDLDVIVGNDHTTPNSSRIYLNQLIESGLPVTFAPGIDFGSPNDLTTEILIGDLNADGKPDIVMVNAAQGISTGINRFFMNTSTPGDIQISAGTDISADVDRSNGGVLADFDGDGDLDLAVANFLASNPGQSSRNRLYLNQFVPSGTVSFAAGLDISTDEQESHDLTAADLNGDTLIDIVVGNSDDVPLNVSARDRRYLNNGTVDPFANVVPVINAQANVLTTDEETDLTIVIADVDVTDADNLFPGDFTLTVQAGTGYTVTNNTITPGAGFAGDLSVPVIVNDGTDDSVAFELTVTVNNTLNSPPEFTSAPVVDATEGVVYIYAVTASDADVGETLTITAPVLPAWLTLTNNGDGTATLEGTPAAGDVGNHDVSLQVADATAIDVQDFTIAVATTPVGNVAPVITSTAVTGATEAVVYTYNVIATDGNAGDTLVITAPTLPDWLTLTDNSDRTATLTGTPDVGDVGNHDVSLQVSDGSLEGMQAFKITVAAAPIGNVAPKFTSTPVTAATDAAAYTYSVTASDANAGDTLVITAATTLPTWLILTDNGDRTATLAGTPGTADVGDHNVSLQVSDGSLEALQAFTIAVAAATSGNTAPAFTSTPVVDATAGTTYTYEVAASDADTGDTLEISGPTLPAWLMLSDNGDGTATLTGTPAAGDVGDHDISLEVSDGTDTVEQVFTITVEAAATPPPPPPSGGGGGGGGSLGFLTLLALGSIAVRRRRFDTKGESETGE